MAIKYLSGITVDSTVLVVDSANDRVGIGTASPGFRLDVVGSDSAVARIYTTNSAQTISIGSTNQTQYTDIILPTDDGQGEIFRAGSGYSSYGGVRALNIWNSNGPIAFHPNNTGNVMYLSTTGNVGIGTTSPNAKLEVAGSEIRLTSGGAYGTISAYNTGATGGSGFLGYQNGVANAFFGVAGWYLANSDTGIIVGTDSSSRPIRFYTNTERMRITGGGNVLINTTTDAGYKLYVNGIISSETGFLLNSGAYNAITDVPYIGMFATGSSSTDGFGALLISSRTDIARPIIFGTSNGTNSVERMRIAANGNVGIGTTSPSVALHTNGFIRSANSGNTVYTEVQNDGLYATGTDLYLLAPSTKFISFYAGGAERMRISSAGALKLNAYGSGSNTGTATQRLAVDASGNVIEIPIGSGPVDGTGTANYVTKWSDSDTITNSSVYDDGTGDVRIVNAATYRGLAITTPTASARPTLTLLNTNYAQYGSYIQDVNGVIAFGRMNYDFGGHSEAMRITSAGNVGIGTTAPEAKLHVVSGASEAGILSRGASGDTWFPYTNGQNYVRGVTNFDLGSVYFTGGNVGIGTTSPGKKLDILQSSDSSYAINIGNSARYTYIGYSDTYQLDFGATGTNDNVRYGVFSVGGGVATFHTNGSERMRITSAGNVGIGTTSPIGNLEISTPSGDTIFRSVVAAGGTASSNDLAIKQDFISGVTANYLWSNSNYTLGVGRNGGTMPTTEAEATALSSFVVANTGNVGIGTTTPSQKLHVSGNVRVTGAYYDSNNEAGSANNFLTSTGTGTDWKSQSDLGLVDGSGTANKVSKWSDSNTLTDANITDNGTTVRINSLPLMADSRLAIGTAGSDQTYASLFIGGNLTEGSSQYALLLDPQLDGTTNYGMLSNARIAANVTATTAYGIYQINNELLSGASIVNNFGIYIANQTSGTTQNWNLYSVSGKNYFGGNVLIGTTTDAGYKLQVEGSIRSVGAMEPSTAAWVDAAFTTKVGGSAYGGGLALIDGTAGWAMYTTGSGQYLNLSSGTTSGGVTTRMSLKNNGVVRLNAYGSGGVTGTATYNLAVDANGDIIETLSPTLATSLYDLLPAGRVAYNWTGQVVNDTWTTIFSKSDNILTTGTWMVKMYVNDFAVGGGHYQYVYSGIMTWEQGTVNQTGEAAFSEIYLHRMGHAANASVLYLRTAESGAAAGNLGYFQIKGNYSNTSNTTINFKFVKIF